MRSWGAEQGLRRWCSCSEMPLPCHMSVNLSVLWFRVHRMGAAPVPFSFVFCDAFGCWWLQNSFMVLIFVPLGNAQRQVIDINCWMSALCKQCVWALQLAGSECAGSHLFFSAPTPYFLSGFCYSDVPWWKFCISPTVVVVTRVHKLSTRNTGGSLRVMVGFSMYLHPDSA